VETQIEL